MARIKTIREVLEEKLSVKEYFNKAKNSLFPAKDTYSFTFVNGKKEFYLQRHTSRWRAIFLSEKPLKIGRVSYEKETTFERLGAGGRLKGKDFPVFRKLERMLETDFISDNRPLFNFVEMNSKKSSYLR